MAWRASSSGDAGRRGDHGVAHAVDLLRLDDRIGDGLAVRGADDVRRQLPYEVDLLLGQDRHAGPEGVGGVRRGPDDPHALAVVAAADRLEDDREAVTLGAFGTFRKALGREGRHVLDVAHDAMARARHADLVELRSHHALVLGVHERVGAGADGDAVRLQGPQMLGRDVLVIESDHIAPACEGAQRLQVAVVADDDIADDLRRGILRGVTEELESDAERDARLVCHTGELAPADHADYRERHPPRVSARPSRPELHALHACDSMRTGNPQRGWLAWLG